MTDDPEHTGMRALRKIAAQLGVPIADFFKSAAGTPPSQCEINELVTVFSALRDSAARRAFINTLKAAASGLPPNETDDDPGSDDR